MTQEQKIEKRWSLGKKISTSQMQKNEKITKEMMIRFLKADKRVLINHEEIFLTGPIEESTGTKTQHGLAELSLTSIEDFSGFNFGDDEKEVIVAAQSEIDNKNLVTIREYKTQHDFGGVLHFITIDGAPDSKAKDGLFPENLNDEESLSFNTADRYLADENLKVYQLEDFSKMKTQNPEWFL